MYSTYISHNVVPHKSHSILLRGSIIFVNGGFQETSCLSLSLKHKNKDNKNMSKSLCYFGKCQMCSLHTEKDSCYGLLHYKTMQFSKEIPKF